ILGSDRALRGLVVKELEQDAKKYGDPRRSAIESAERASIERSVVEEPVTVILSQRGWIRARNGHGIDMNAVSFKDGDERFVEIECRTTDQLVLLGQSGKTYTLAVASLPSGRGDGVPVNTLISSDRDPIRWMSTGRPDMLHLLHTSAGNGFICRLGDMISRTRSGKDFMTVPASGQVMPALALWPADEPPKHAGKLFLAALSSDSRLLLFPLTEVPARANGGLGVQLIALPEGVTLASVAVSDGRTLEVSGERRAKQIRESLGGGALQEHVGKRAQRGRVLDARLKSPRLIAQSYG
ncbi:MAG: DNA topoisomerase IV subunit A, partial [Burkholderiales bacterium]